MKQSMQYKTYGRKTVLSKQNLDFDKVFKNGPSGDSVGNSPFSSSDSSVSRSINISNQSAHYNFRKQNGTGRDKVSDSLNVSSSDDKDVKTPLQRAPKRATRRVRNREKCTSKTSNIKASRPDDKENTYDDQNIPDYDAIAEDSFVVESEHNVKMAKCSTPVTCSIGSLDLLNDSEKMPTPIFRVLRSSKLLANDEDCIERSRNHSCSPNVNREYEHSNVTRRRPSRLHDRRISTRKILIDKDCVKGSDCSPLLNNSSHHNFVEDSESSLLLKEPFDKSSLSSCHQSTNESHEELFRSLRENINSFAKINLSLDTEEIEKKISPYKDFQSPTFDVSDDLFETNENVDSNSNIEGLSCICEENEELRTSIKADSAVEIPSLSFKSDEQKHTSDSFYDKLVTQSICEHETQSAEEKLMAICEQQEFISFSTCLPSRMMAKCIKIGEGVYGEVFRSISRDKNVAIKIIPIQGNFNVNDCPQKTFDEILPEAVIAKELSDLASGSCNSNFCQVNRISCVQGCFPSPLLKQWDAYAQRKVSENDRPDFFPDDQLFMVFEFLDGGTALENFEMSNHKQTFSILRQVVYALAVAESTLEFEHRDLHIGNVLVRSCKETAVNFSLDGEDIEFATEGVFATIIDFTISRLKKDGCAVFCDISSDDGLFEGNGDFQFDVYRDMKKSNHNDWSKFCPYSNVLWVKYLCRKLLTAIKVKDTGREFRDNQRKLRQLNESVLKYESCFHMATDYDLWEI